MRSAVERETIILYNQSEGEASVYSFDPKMISKLEKLASKYPDEIRLEKEHGDGVYTYTVPKECVVIREPYSKERREAVPAWTLEGKAGAVILRGEERCSGTKQEI